MRDSGKTTEYWPPTQITDDLIGKNKGIQGNMNSCYLDSTLFAMFAQSTAFDYIFHNLGPGTTPLREEFITVLKTEVVFPLRRNGFVSSNHIAKLRKILAKHFPKEAKNLTENDRDPEEVFVPLFRDFLNVEPFVKTICGEGQYDDVVAISDNATFASPMTETAVPDKFFFCNTIVENWNGGVVTTQHLLERWMLQNCYNFSDRPMNLIIQLPQTEPKIFERFVPLLTLEIGLLRSDASGQCASCSQPALGTCRHCLFPTRKLLKDCCFCEDCFYKYHFLNNMDHHSLRKFHAPKTGDVFSRSMKLSSVLVRRNNHFVSFVRSPNDRWFHFDSMAKRDIENHVPWVTECSDVGQWLTMDGWQKLIDKNIPHEQLPSVNAVRLLDDAYFCFYE